MYERTDKLFHDVSYLRGNRDAHRKELVALHATLLKDAAKHSVIIQPRSQWCFPLKGYSARAIGGKDGKAYMGARGYDFLDGNAHGGHPAYDLFIRDRNQDCLDDRNGKPVQVVSVSGGVVVCVQPAWTSDSVDAKGKVLRGGIAVWVYDPASDGLFYYAHMRRATCKLGQYLNPGDALGEVGRTGLNAWPKRSSTHLHIMYLSFKDGRPLPEPIYEDLVRAAK